ncbi:MAG TPA: PBP1A family penicillin-binding protein [Salinisphaeraceae bacterium]|nr:PBP1A family penicillin-binding protein [Salinisphaeraceae bacterium]
MKILSPFLKSLAALFSALLTALLLAVCVAIGLFLYYGEQLPATNHVTQATINEPLRIYTANGELIRSFGGKLRLPVTYEQIPQILIEAFLAAEDDRFFQHPGVDYQGLARAALNLVATGSKSQGGSTITMQLARNMYLSRERTFTRKFKEIILALRLESRLGKRQILALYLNNVYLGSGTFGVGAAAKVYYDKEVDELTLAQAATIAGLPKAPSLDNPRHDPERARSRRAYVLGRMLHNELIDQAAYEQAMAQPIVTAERGASERFRGADYIAEMVRREMIERYGDEVYSQGYRVYTTINIGRQSAAVHALRDNLLAYDARHGWRGAQKTLPEEVLSDDKALQQALAEHAAIGSLLPAAVLATEGAQMTLATHKHGDITLGAAANPWLKRGAAADSLVSPGDIVWLRQTEAEDKPWQLAQIPEVQGALIALNPMTGAVQALVGGFAFKLSNFNRAVEAYRQPGSAIKPFIYAAALANGFTAASLINDAPVVYGTSSGAWRPENYGRGIHGPTRLREGLVHSRNLMTIRLLRAVGIGNTIDFLTRFGLPRERMPRNLTLALGTPTFTPMQMAAGLAVMANGGYRVMPYLIDRIENARGELVFQAEPAVVCQQATGCDPLLEAHTQAELDAPWAPRVIAADTAYIIGDIMRDVIQRGTGGGARVLGRNDLSGKTGTTNDMVDAWFTGFNSRLVAVAWVGFDNPHTLGARETGARAALPIWVDFMRIALQGVPESIMPRPDEIVNVRINPHTGQKALDGGGIAEIFSRDAAPTAKEARTHREFDPTEEPPDRLF